MAQIGTLAERLKSKIQEDQQTLDNQTSEALKEHAKSLKKLSGDALITTKAAIGQHQKSLLEMHQDTLQRLRWLMLWPLLSSLCISLLVVVSASVWSWWKINQVDEQVQAKQQQIQRLEAEFCNSPAGLKICKKG